MVDRVATDWRTAGVDAQTQALLEYAEKLTREPNACGAADIERLRVLIEEALGGATSKTEAAGATAGDDSAAAAD